MHTTGVDDKRLAPTKVVHLVSAAKNELLNAADTSLVALGGRHPVEDRIAIGPAQLIEHRLGTEGLVAKAASMTPKNFVRVDMEGSPYTQRTLDFVHELHRVPGNEGNVGTVIQAYMRRSEADVEKLLNERIRIRLCKGAYKEPADIAFQKKSEVDASYVKLMKILMKSGVFHGLATHDEAIIKEAKAFATRENIPRNAFEFQMLHGIRRDLQQALVKDGWGMRVYIPFGTEWYPYYMRRLAERPANVLFIAKNILRK